MPVINAGDTSISTAATDAGWQLNYFDNSNTVSGALVGEVIFQDGTNSS